MGSRLDQRSHSVDSDKGNDTILAILNHKLHPIDPRTHSRDSAGGILLVTVWKFWHSILSHDREEVSCSRQQCLRHVRRKFVEEADRYVSTRLRRNLAKLSASSVPIRKVPPLRKRTTTHARPHKFQTHPPRMLMWMPQPSRSNVRPTSTLAMSSYRTVLQNNGIGPKRILRTSP